MAQGFSHATTLGCGEAWLASLAFALQIYCDFSGYTDMGRGSALMMGYELPDNFNWPYIAKNLTDFWKRWHISLSSWLRDYLYIPMGGSKCSMPRRYFNLFMTMLLGGLWHGASWHYVVWGAFHGSGLIVCHSYDHWLAKNNAALANGLRAFHASALGTFSSQIITFAFVLVGWVFFRAETVGQAVDVLKAMFAPQVVSSWLAFDLERYPIFAAILAYCIYRLVEDNLGKITSIISRWRTTGTGSSASCAPSNLCGCIYPGPGSGSYQFLSFHLFRFLKDGNKNTTGRNREPEYRFRRRAASN